MADRVIETSGLDKRFGRVQALDGLDLVVEQGAVHGFLGPNGAGKSTTIRVLLGMLRASGGEARVLGMDPWRDAVAIHRRAAYVPGDVTLWPGLTGGEAIDTITRLRGHRAPASDRARLIEAFDLDPRRRSKTYSKGNRQKIALIAAFASEADLYILDEPTSGLDPLMESVFQAEIRRVADRGATVLLSSHILSEVERLCSTVSIIRDGRIVEAGTLEQLRHLHHTVVAYRGPAPEGLPLADVSVDGEHVRASVAAEHMPEVLRWLGDRGAQAVTLTPPSLEELFLRHYGDEARVDSARAERAKGQRHADETGLADGPDADGSEAADAPAVAPSSADVDDVHGRHAR
ncbi:ABC transporter ATP-binding protein [Agrococcus sediminis]|uniref:ABC transporter ATP-binding protein n=1 Tax=Agrococcus sediminis TaxID=2599924 RepID=A0A5M8QJE0_9MICO|nr:ABC transporter ATP-binding protein [Agrococcus sediminis]KAA6436175.1 ABC transporter ATP-binding protein [Agrococcus sediminis]